MPDTAVPDAPARPFRYSRYPLIVLFLLALLDAADRSLLATVFPLIKEEFHVSDARLGALASVYTVVGAVAVIPFGILVDRYRRTSIAALGVTIWSWCMIAVGAAGSFAMLLVTRSMLGVAEASRGPAGFSLLSDYYPVEVRARRMALMQIGTYAGGLVLPLAGIVAHEWGWRAAFYVLAAPGFVVAVMAWWLPEPPRGAQDAAHHRLAHDSSTRSELARLPALKAFGQVLRIPTMLLTLTNLALLILGIAGMGIWLTTYVVRYHDLNVATGSSVLALTAVGSVAGAMIGGSLGDRLAKRYGEPSRMRLIGVAMVAGAVLLVLAFAVSSRVVFFALLGLGFTTITMAFPVQSALWAAVLHPDLRGRGVALTGLASIVGAAVSPLLVGVLSDALSLRTAFLLLLPILAVGGLLVLVLGPRYVTADQQRMLTQLGGAPATVADNEPAPGLGPTP